MSHPHVEIHANREEPDTDCLIVHHSKWCDCGVDPDAEYEARIEYDRGEP